MAFHLKIIGDKTLEIRYTGAIKIEETIAARENAITMIRSNRLNQVFLDVREAEPDMSYVDIFNLAASAKKVYPTIKRYAVLYTERDKTRSKLEMFVRTSSKRGFKMKVFSDLNKAKNWLHI